jgi:hypothetical protein
MMTLLFGTLRSVCARGDVRSLSTAQNNLHSASLSLLSFGGAGVGGGLFTGGLPW